MPPSPEALAPSVFDACERHLNGHGPRIMRDELSALSGLTYSDAVADQYGRGAVLEQLEAELATLLGKPAAVFMPSGTMAQQIALRIHAERAGRQVVGFHPTCHLELHEHRAYEHLVGLRARLVGARDDVIRRTDLDAIEEELGALLIELPQREIGGVLPPWEELIAQHAWARERGVALHLDGARLWESGPFYQRSYAEIAALFDTVYVSFYKGLGAIAGAALAGPLDVIAEARIWQRRFGGNLVSMYPLALSARARLAERLPRMAAYRERAVQIAAVLAQLPGLRITPDPPHTNMMHVIFPLPPERLIARSTMIAERERVALFRRARAAEQEGHCVAEISVGEGAFAIGDDELSRLVSTLCSERE